jgi:excisionase family DNA binding protein
MEKLLKEREVAELLSIATRTVRQLAHDGKLPRVKIGDATRYRPSDIRRLIDHNGEMQRAARERPSATSKRLAGRRDAKA